MKIIKIISILNDLLCIAFKNDDLFFDEEFDVEFIERSELTQKICRETISPIKKIEINPWFLKDIWKSNKQIFETKFKKYDFYLIYFILNNTYILEEDQNKCTLYN